MAGDRKGPSKGHKKDEIELPSPHFLLNLDSTRPRSDSEDPPKQKGLTESNPQIQGRMEVLGLNDVPILQELSDHEVDDQAPVIRNTTKGRRLAAFALEDSLVLTSGNSSTTKRSSHRTDECPHRGADVYPSSKHQLKRPN